MNYLHGKKKVIQNQNYEEYWKLTLAFTDYFGSNFIRNLSVIIDHIDKYNLNNKTLDEVSYFKGAGKKRYLREEVVHRKDLEDKINFLSPSRDNSGATSRKKINTFVKLGFIKPFLLGYSNSAKKYVNTRDLSTLKRLFSDTVYKYASFNSSQTIDDTKVNQINFIIQTILNRDTDKRYLNHEELMGLMVNNIEGRKYAKEIDIERGKRWVEYDGFENRKYNQIKYLQSVLSKLSMFTVVGSKNDFSLHLVNDDLKKIPNTNTKRDPYRFEMMKQAVYEESMKYYKKKICWLTKKETEGLVVSHLYASAAALQNWDTDEAYDPNNALLLNPGSPDKYIDSEKMTILDDGNIVFGPDVKSFFIDESKRNDYHIDEFILNNNRKKYIHIHQDKFIEKYPYLKDKVKQ